MTLQPLFNHFESYIPLKGTEKQLLERIITERQLKRKQAILQEGFPCKHYTFILTGCLRMFAIDQKGTEHNILFAAENNWIADISSFHSGNPSRLFIESIEASCVLQIEQQDLYSLYINAPKFDRIFRVIIENKYVALQNRVLQTISSTAQERYLAFLEEYRSLALRLPNTHIASYLGITPEFLSKIRRDLAS